jgi:hypothetical protein
MCARLLLSTQRAGSYFLKSLIESRFSTVACTGEVLEEPVAFARQFPALASHPEIPLFWLWYELQAASRGISVAPGRRLEAFEIYLSQLEAAAKPKNLLVDVKYNTIRALGGYWDTENGSGDFASFVISRQIPVLHLIRKNILRILISQELAKKTNVWLRTKERTDDELLPKIQLNPKTILAEIQSLHRLTADYKTWFANHPGYQEIVYEDIVGELERGQNGASIRALGQFFSKKASSVNLSAIPCKKIAPEDPSEIVENWDEVLRALHYTEHGWMAQSPMLKAA